MGFGPVFFPAQRRLGHGPIPAQPVPVDAFPFVAAFPPDWPPLQQDARLGPQWKAVVGRGRGTPRRVVQGMPLAAGTQDLEDGLGTLAVRNTRPATAKAMPIHRFREQPF